MTIHDKLSGWVVSSDAASVNGEPAGFTYTKTRNGQTTAWAGAPEATVAADGTVSWPVTSSGGKLEDGVTYTVSFNVKPTQAAFDNAARQPLRGTPRVMRRTRTIRTRVTRTATSRTTTPALLSATRPW